MTGDIINQFQYTSQQIVGHGQLVICMVRDENKPLFQDSQIYIPRCPKDQKLKNNLRIKHGESLEYRTEEGLIF